MCTLYNWVLLNLCIFCYFTIGPQRNSNSCLYFLVLNALFIYVSFLSFHFFLSFFRKLPWNLYFIEGSDIVKEFHHRHDCLSPISAGGNVRFLGTIYRIGEKGIFNLHFLLLNKIWYGYSVASFGVIEGEILNKERSSLRKNLRRHICDIAKIC